MPMKTNKQRRRAFRRALANNGMLRPDRFTEMMNAIAGGGSEACECCGLVTWANDLDDRAVCPACRRAFGKLRKRVPRPEVVVAHDEPKVVWVDASYRDGFAGLAVCGALGEHTQRVEATTSTQAETLALKWAMDIAEEGGIFGLTFRTDCEKAYNVLKQTPARFYWTVERIPRERNRRADHLANEARVS